MYIYIYIYIYVHIFLPPRCCHKYNRGCAPTPTASSSPAPTASTSPAPEFDCKVPCGAWTCIPAFSQGEPLVSHCLSNAGFLQNWRTMLRIMMALDTTNNAYNK